MTIAHPLSANDTIATVLATRPAAARVFLSHRMHCVGCDLASFETLAEACAAYGLPVGELLADLDRPNAGRQEDNS